MFSTSTASATRVGTHGACRLKKARLSISIIPLNVSPSEKAASAPATTVRLAGLERAALVEQPDDRLGEDGADDRATG